MVFSTDRTEQLSLGQGEESVVANRAGGGRQDVPLEWGARLLFVLTNVDGKELQYQNRQAYGAVQKTLGNESRRS